MPSRDLPESDQEEEVDLDLELGLGPDSEPEPRDVGPAPDRLPARASRGTATRADRLVFAPNQRPPSPEVRGADLSRVNLPFERADEIDEIRKGDVDWIQDASSAKSSSETTSEDGNKMSDMSDRLARLEERHAASEQRHSDFRDEIGKAFARIDAGIASSNANAREDRREFSTNLASAQTALMQTMRDERVATSEQLSKAEAAIEARIQGAKWTLLATMVGGALALVGAGFALVQTNIAYFESGRGVSAALAEAKQAAQQAADSASSARAIPPQTQVLPPSNPASKN